MAKETGTDILKTIIAKSTNPEAVGIAQVELNDYKERKAALSAAIKPVLDVPQIVADPQSTVAAEMVGKQRRGSITSDQDSVVKDIKQIRSDINKISEESKKSRTLLESILSSNLKYYESNNELLNRLLIANGLLTDKFEAMGNKIAPSTSAAGAAGGLQPQGQPSAGGPSLLDYALGGSLLARGLGAIGRGIKGLARVITSPFRSKPPKIDTPKVDIPKANAPDLPETKARKSLLDLAKKGGRKGLVAAGLIAAGASALWVMSFFEANEETQAKMINELLGYVPDWLEGFVMEKPELAILLGVQVPEILMNSAMAVKETKTIVKGTTEAFKGYSDLYKNFTFKPPKPAEPPKRIFPTGAAGTEFDLINQASDDWMKPSSAVGEIIDDTQEIKKLSRFKSGLKTTGQVLKISKETIGKAVAKAFGEKAAGIAGKKIPLFGLGLAGMMAALRAYEGDTYGAGLELLSGGLSLIPSVGTAGSVAVDAKLMADDLYEQFYGIRPDKETDQALRDKRWKEIYDSTIQYLNEQIQNYDVSQSAAGQLWNMLPDLPDMSTLGERTPQPFNNPRGAGARTTKPVDNSSAYQGEITPEEAFRTLQGSRSSPPTREGIGVKIPLPVPKRTQEEISSIGNPTGAGPNNVVIKQGDTINNVTNNNTAGGGTGSVSGSPSKVPSPFDYLLYGDTFNWGY